MGYLTGYLALMAGIFLFLYWLLQPVRIVNAGQSVYIPPPQTRLIPLPRKMDAPELMETAETAPPVSPLAALAEAPAPSNSDSGRPTKKRHRAEAAQREARRGYVVERSSAYYRSYDRYWQRSYRGW
jgi:hypothetical protein